MNSKEDAATIVGLIHETYFCLDAGDFNSFAGYFANAEFGTSEGLVSGSAAVLQTLTSRIVLHAGSPRTHHLVTNLVIQVNDSRARAQYYVTVIQLIPDSQVLRPIFSGYYEDRLVQHEGGWEFRRRTIRPDLVGELSHHVTA